MAAEVKRSAPQAAPLPGESPYETLVRVTTGGKKRRKPKAAPRPSPTAVAPAGPGVVVGFVVPVHTLNESNGSQGSWRPKAAKRKAARKAAALHARAVMWPAPKPPLVVLITRHSAGSLDDDALRSAGKSIRDGVADWLGVDDADTQAVAYGYAHSPCKRGFSWVTVEVRRAT